MRENNQLYVKLKGKMGNISGLDTVDCKLAKAANCFEDQVRIDMERARAFFFTLRTASFSIIMSCETKCSLY